jgi:hypothetical protein
VFGLLSKYLVKSFVIAIRGSKYNVCGDPLSNTVIEVLESLRSGESLSVEEVSISNRESGSEFGVSISYRFAIP